MSLPLILLARYFAQMNIMNLALLLHFAERHPESRNALFSWLRLVRSERWHNPHDAIALHSNVRNLGSNRLTFNIRGNPTPGDNTVIGSSPNMQLELDMMWHLRGC